MFAFKTLSAAAILALAAGCQTTSSTMPGGSPKWAAHEEINRTYVNRCTLRARDPVPMFDNESTNRIYEACCPLIQDDPSPKWATHEEISRTYHTCCRMFPVDPALQSVSAEEPQATGSCAGPERDSACVHCGR